MFELCGLWDQSGTRADGQATTGRDPVLREQVKNMLQGVTKQHLQDPAVVRQLIASVSSVLGIVIGEQQTANITQFVIDQEIDPNNLFHLLKLWGMFR